MARKTITWVHEKEAAEMIGYVPRTLRRYVKTGKLLINFSSFNQRRYKYCKEDIEQLILSHSTFLVK